MISEQLVSDVVSKEELFRYLGYADSHDLMEVLLEEEGLSRPAKARISTAKVDQVSTLLLDHFIAVCARGDCRAEASDPDQDRIVVSATTPMHCEICHGSMNARAVDEMVEALRSAGCSRLCVVGGSPTSHAKLQDLVRDRLELRLIDGTRGRNGSQARGDLQWADLVVIWGSTMLGHRVSLLYDVPRVIRIGRRSIRNLSIEVARADILRERREIES